MGVHVRTRLHHRILPSRSLQHKDSALPSQATDLTVINIGVHYHDRTRYTTDIRNLFAECVHPHCVFRETLPQHFLYKNRTDGSHLRHGHPGWTDGHNSSCGEISGRTMYAEVEEQSAVEFKQPLMKVRDAMRGLHNEHVGHDCTHFCSDTYVWKHLHQGLLKILSQMNGSHKSVRDASA